MNAPERPKTTITIPSGKFTFADLEKLNPHLTPLTLRKFLQRDIFNKNKELRTDSMLVRLLGKTDKKQFVYILRKNHPSPKQNSRYW